MYVLAPQVKNSWGRKSDLAFGLLGVADLGSRLLTGATHGATMTALLGCGMPSSAPYSARYLRSAMAMFPPALSPETVMFSAEMPSVRTRYR